MKTLIALFGLARCVCSLLEAGYTHQVVPVEYQFGGGL